jgi:hypothetical protein
MLSRRNKNVDGIDRRRKNSRRAIADVGNIHQARKRNASVLPALLV